MERFKTLIQLNIKRAFKSLLLLVIGAIALIFLVSAIAFCSQHFPAAIESSSIDGMSFRIGVVMNDTSSMANTIAKSITSMSEVTDYIEFVFTDEDTVMKGLDNSEYIAAMIIPENTVDGIIHGDNIPIQVVFPEDSGYEALIIKEVTDAAGIMLSSAQAGIYSIYDFYDDHSAASHKKDANLRMNLKYITLAATGTNMFDITETTSTGSIPLMTYYISSGLVLFMILLGINCYSFIGQTPAYTSKRLTQNGTPLILQELADYLSIAVTLFTTICIIVIPAVLIMSIFNFTLSATGIVALLLILPVFTLLSSAFIYFISRITPHNMSRIMITFFAALIMCFISGCFIPSIMLPDIIQTISRFTPAYYMMELAGNLLSGSFHGLSLLMCPVYAIILLLLGMLFSHIRLRKELA